MFDALAQAIPYNTVHLHGVTLAIKRLDSVHPQISGNKFFKLKYNFAAAQQQGLKQVLTFGGAYSNHIAATAYAAHLFGMQSIGIIRGEELAHKALNPTLQTAQDFGMQLQFVSRDAYRLKQSSGFLTQLQAEFPNGYIIPEGGTNPLAIQGCTEILSPADLENFDLICCAAGTGGTIAGLIEASAAHQQVLGFSALKGDFLTQDVKQWTARRNWRITDEFCQGGYAKTTPELMQFIQEFETAYSIPLEQIYTGKMLFGIQQMILRGEIKPEQRVLILHTGGLQGKIQR
ncbi:1-aminocyclopropane-1-carboxylate deaminase/D-cysteine desulfhydrase [Acinetobacter bouvetii]|uniref:1-aminocyclopropane-1-carboxylate deaminase/D-cysteine desulfhydrase n=1 Tax=Acinetobacter bouvetii TaxID=202951 RepID=A0A4Q7B1A2_9GAMM|nr:pyridoxal-phosphate dependent enzyme [Acinetobacter bouvetii]RZG68844.1 1-aminocyclopropane-1-carboxylate deaminase/D-cysteine desulfhydrase [Acinetobacter bouvetii]